jgi:ABC-type lipoprotein export system ATPase subunit
MGEGTNGCCFELKGVRKTYSGPEDMRETGLHPLSLTIPRGIRLAIVGHSGSGKSTLLHLLGLLDVADPADDADLIYHEGDTAWSYAGLGSPVLRPVLASKRDEFRHRHFGFVFQKGHLLGHLTCAENVALGLTLEGHPPTDRLRRATDLLKGLGLGDKVHKKPRQLSGGEAQRVAVLRAIAHSPQVVFADEPTGNLDADHAARVLELLRSWQLDAREGPPRTLLLVTHNLQDAARYCDHFLVLRQGRALGRDGAGDSPHLFTPQELGSPDKLPEKLLALINGGGPKTDASPVSCSVGFESRRTAGRPRLRDLALFAVRDLIRREHVWTTVNNGLIILFMVVLGVVGLGFFQGQRRVRDRLDQSEARALTVESDRGLIDEETIRALLALHLPDGRPAIDPRRGGVKRWNLAREIFWTGTDRPVSQLDHRLDGRTADLTDPWLKDLPVAGFSHPLAREILVTESFLVRECGSPRNAPCVWLEYHGTPVRFAVVGVVPSLPGEAAFVLPDPLYQTMQAGLFEPEPLLPCLYLTPWNGDVERACQLLAERLEEERLELKEGPGRLEVAVARGRRQAAEVLREQAASLARALEEAGLAPASTLRVELPPPIDPQVPNPSHGRATIYLSSIFDLEDVAAAIAPLGLRPSDDALLGAVRLIRNTVGPLATMITAFALLALAIAVLNLGVTMWQRVKEKTAEIGILKANGMTTAQLLLMYGAEGFFLGLAVSPAGLFLGLGAEHLFNRTLHEMSTRPGSTLLLHLDAVGLACVLAFTLVLCPLICVLATAVSARTPPAQAIA